MEEAGVAEQKELDDAGTAVESRQCSREKTAGSAEPRELKVLDGSQCYNCC
jgi:hypothetical protein